MHSSPPPFVSPVVDRSAITSARNRPHSATAALCRARAAVAAATRASTAARSSASHARSSSLRAAATAAVVSADTRATVARWRERRDASRLAWRRRSRAGGGGGAGGGGAAAAGGCAAAAGEAGGGGAIRRHPLMVAAGISCDSRPAPAPAGGRSRASAPAPVGGESDGAPPTVFRRARRAGEGVAGGRLWPPPCTPLAGSPAPSGGGAAPAATAARVGWRAGGVAFRFLSAGITACGRGGVGRPCVWLGRWAGSCGGRRWCVCVVVDASTRKTAPR